MVHGFGRDREVGCTFGRHLRDLRRRALMQVQADVFIALTESVNDRRQRVAGLRMRGGNRQITAVGVVEFVGNAPDVLDFTEQALGTVENAVRSEEHTSELQSLMSITYAVFCLKKKKK